MMGIGVMMDYGVQQYVEAQIMTATPQKLRLLLIEGGIRFARQAIVFWDEGQNEKALESIIRSRDIVSELLAGVRQDNTDLTRQVAGVYAFLFRTLTDAQMRRDRQMVNAAVEVLEIERETWRLVCEKLPERPMELDQAGFRRNETREIIAPSTGIGGPPISGLVFDA